MRDIAPVTFAHVGGPPDDWAGWRVIDNVTGAEVPGVVQINTVTGIVFRFDLDDTDAAVACSRAPPCGWCPPSEHARVIVEVGDFRIERK